MIAELYKLLAIANFQYWGCAFPWYFLFGYTNYLKENKELLANNGMPFCDTREYSLCCLSKSDSQFTIIKDCMITPHEDISKDPAYFTQMPLSDNENQKANAIVYMSSKLMFNVPEWATRRRNIQSSKATNALGCSTFSHLQNVLKKPNGKLNEGNRKHGTEQPFMHRNCATTFCYHTKLSLLKQLNLKRVPV